MPDDLADRISEGAVNVLELVPGEKRFVDLSRHVLKGGAERFRPVVLPDEPIRYLVPVGVPGAKLDFGTLLVQHSRVVLVWRTDHSRPYHAVVCALSNRTTVSQTAVVVRGETWGRFDLRDDNASMTFLVPPVTTSGLPRALHEALIEEPGSRVARFATAPLASAITAEGTDADGATPFVGASDVAPDAPLDPERAALEREAAQAPTQVVATSSVPDSRPEAPEWARDDPAATAVVPAQPAAPPTQVLPAQPAAPPTQVLPAQPAAPPTHVQPAQPAAPPSKRAPAPPGPPPSARVRVAEPAPVYREPSPAPARSLLGPDTTRGFFIGLLATLGAGAIVLILLLLGG